MFQTALLPNALAFVTALLLSILQPNVAQADVDFTNLPTVEQVLEEHVGSDARDTAARQHAALITLMSYIEKTTGKGWHEANAMPPAAGAKYEQYKKARTELQRRDGGQNASNYMNDNAFRLEVLGPHMPLGTRVMMKVANAIEPTVESGQALAEDLGISPKRMASFLVVLLLLIPGVLGFISQIISRFGILPSKPSELRVGRARYQLFSRTGEVTHYGKGRSVTTHVTGSQDHVSSHSTTSVHQEFWLEDADGNESEVQLTNWNVSLHEGHVVSWVTAAKAGKKRRPFIAIRNHSTNASFFNDDMIRRIVKVRAWFVWIVAVCCVSAFFIDDKSIRLRAFQVLAVVFVLGWIHRWIGTRLRTKRFKKQLSKQYFPTFQAAADACSQPIVVDPDVIQGPGGLTIQRG